MNDLGDAASAERLRERLTETIAQFFAVNPDDAADAVLEVLRADPMAASLLSTEPETDNRKGTTMFDNWAQPVTSKPWAAIATVLDRLAAATHWRWSRLNSAKARAWEHAVGAAR